MKKYVIFILFIIFCGCDHSGQQINSLTHQLDSLKKENEILRNHLIEAQVTIKELKNTPSRLLIKAKEFLLSQKTDSAEIELNKIISKHPLSTECKEAKEIISQLEQEKLKKKKEEERLKALGFKVFNSINTFTINKVKYTIGNLSFNKQFTFDYCSDVSEYHYRTADKDATYLQGEMSVTNKDKDNYSWEISLELYRLENGILKYTEYFSREYATWTSYGAMIGNYSDDSHDFDKVNTIRFKIAAEISKKYMHLPLFVLVKKNGKRDLKEKELTPEIVNENFIVVKVINKNKI